MAFSPEMRASDADRDRVAAVLGEHYTQGRLTAEELQERLELVHRSKTYGELERLTADLPQVDLRAMGATPPARRPQRGGGKALAAAWGAWAAASAINWMIWFLIGVTGDFPYPWPVWVMGPWGVALLVATLLGGLWGDRS